MKLLFFFILLIFFSCEDEPTAPTTDCNGVYAGIAYIDNCGICVGGTTGLIENYLADCSGECSGNAFLDCNNNCINISYIVDLEDYDELLNDYNCNYSWPSLNCPQFSCDFGDCGIWDGSQCMGISAVAYSVSDGINEPPGEIGHIYGVYSTDSSIPNPFIWNQYYNSIPGTYYFEYSNISSSNETYEGYYTTYLIEGNVSMPFTCFELYMWGFIGPSLYQWSGNYGDCGVYFGFPESILSNNNEDDILTLERYISDKEKNNNYIHKHSKINKYDSFINSNEVSYNNKLDYSDKIKDIDSNPNVIVQSGKNYIIKYIVK